MIKWKQLRDEQKYLFTPMHVPLSSESGHVGLGMMVVEVEVEVEDVVVVLVDDVVEIGFIVVVFIRQRQ